jgi:hypothetical protein
VAATDSPLWRRAFNDVERRVGRPLASATSSPEFQSATLKLRRARRAVAKPVHSVAGFGLHLAGLPSNSEVRELRRELSEVQREISAMRRGQVQAERDQQGSE